MTDLLQAKRSAARRYLASSSEDSNIVGVGVGAKMTAGVLVQKQAVRFYVVTKFEGKHLPTKRMIPPELDGAPTDVVEVGRVLPAAAAVPSPRAKIRPPRPGCSIGVSRDRCFLSGTFGAVVQDERKTFLLTCNHVIADDDLAFLGRPVWQPGPSDGQGDAIAYVSRFVPIRPRGTAEVDAAIAELSGPVDPALLAPVGRLSGSATGEAFAGMLVEKVGRATEYTAGTVFDIAADFRVPYPFGEVILQNQILIHNVEKYFVFSGDSGALIVAQQTKLAVGLLSASSYTPERGFYGVANHIGSVLRALRVALVG